MAPVANKPFLDLYIENNCVATDIAEVKLSGGIQTRGSSKATSALRYKHLHLGYVVENEPLGTGGGIRLAAEACSADTLLICNGDTFFGSRHRADLSMNMNSQQKRHDHCTESIWKW